MSHNTDSLSDRLCAACNYRDHKMVRELIVEQKADPNKESELGYLPLNICADGKDSEGVRLLIELGADINIHDSNGFTPLSCAAFSGDYKSACLLLNAGADVHNPEKDCKHYVMAAAVTGGSLETVRAIVEAGGILRQRTVITGPRSCMQSDIMISIWSGCFWSLVPTPMQSPMPTSMWYT